MVQLKGGKRVSLHWNKITLAKSAENGNLAFKIDDSPILGLGEGGPQPESGADWHNQAIEFDRKGRFHNMQPRWQSNAYGSRNPVPLILGTGGWGLFSTSSS